MTCKSCMYSKTAAGSYTSTPFAPTTTNWLLSAQKGNNTIYFNSVLAFNSWSKGCCGTTRSAINSGKLNGYVINFNGV